LGTATAGRDGEFLSQATVVRGVLQHITGNADADRDLYLRGKEPSKLNKRASQDFIFRNSFIDDDDDVVFESITNLFSAARERWPVAWKGDGRGYILPRTNGYFALMRYLRDATIYFGAPDTAVSVEKHIRLLERVKLKDDDLTSERFLPGTGGEAALYRELVAAIP